MKKLKRKPREWILLKRPSGYMSYAFKSKKDALGFAVECFPKGKVWLVLVREVLSKARP